MAELTKAPGWAASLMVSRTSCIVVARSVTAWQSHMLLLTNEDNTLQRYVICKTHPDDVFQGSARGSGSFRELALRR